MPGNKIGVKTRFGNGQPVDRGGRPANSVKGMAREIAGEEVKLNDGSKAPVLRLVVNSVAKKAMGGDVRAAEVFAKWHDGDGDLARTQRYLFTMENLAGV